MEVLTYILLRILFRVTFAVTAVNAEFLGSCGPCKVVFPGTFTVVAVDEEFLDLVDGRILLRVDTS